MAKTTIRWLFAGSLIAVAGALACAGGSLVRHGPGGTGIRETLVGGILAGMAGLAALVMIAVAITQFTAWAGAVITAARRKDKTWFIILLVVGLLSFGFIATLIYLIAVA